MTVLERITSKLPSRGLTKSSSSSVANADFFIIYDPAAALEAVQVLRELLTSEGYSVQTNGEDGYVRKQVWSSRVVILYLTSDALLNKEVAAALKAAKNKGKQLMVVHETDEASGAILKRRSRRTVDLPKMLNLSKTKLKGLKVTRSMPFRANLSYAKYVALRLIQSVDLSSFPVTMKRMEDIKRQERAPQSRSWAYTKLIGWMNQGLDRTMMAVVGRSDSGKSVISATLAAELSRPFRTIPYFFNELDHRSRNPHLCLEYFATRLSQLIPDFHRVNFRFENATLLERFNHLVLEPASAVKSPRVQCVVLILDGIDQCLGNEEESIMHMMQTVKLPTWLKVMVTGKHSILAHGTENTTVLDLAEATDNVVDIAQFLERCFRSHMLSTPQEYREGVRAGTQAAQGNFFYLHFVEDLVQQHPGMTLASINMPESLQDIMKALLQSLKKKSGSLPLRMILALILAVREPLPVEMIREICDIQLTDIDSLFEESPLFYVMNGMVQFSRPAFKQFLTDPSNGEYHINVTDAHALLVEWCLKYTGMAPDLDDMMCATSGKHVGEEEQEEGALHVSAGTEEAFESGPLESAFGYSHLVYHLCQTERFNEVYFLLTQFKWLLGCVQNDAALLVVDLETYYSSDDSVNDNAVHTITTFLRLSLDALKRDHRELASQLLGRIGQHATGCENLVESAANFTPGDGVSWWRPLQPTLEQADEKRLREARLAGEVHACAVSNDGKVIAAAGSDNAICLFRGGLSSGGGVGSLVKSLKAHSERVNDLQFSPDSRRLASASNDTTAIVWDIARGTQLYILSGHITGVSQLSFTSDGAYLTTASQLSAKVWDITGKAQGEEAACVNTRWKSTSSISAVRASLINANEFALGFEDGKTKVLSVSEPEADPITLEDGHKRAITCILFMPGNQLATGSYDRTICVWDLSKLTQQLKLRVHSEKVTSLSMLNGHLITTSLESDGLKFWDLNEQDPKSSIRTSSRGVTCSAAFNGSQPFLVCGDTEGGLRIFHGEELHEPTAEEIDHHQDWIAALAVCPSTNNIATGSWDGTIKVWSSISGSLLKTFHPERYDAQPFVYSLDGKYFLSRVGAWSAENGERVHYSTIPKENRQRVDTNLAMEGTDVKGFENIIEAGEDVNGVSFTSDSADHVSRKILPIQGASGHPIGVICSGNKVHLLELVQ